MSRTLVHTAVAWLQAARLPSQVNIAPMLLLGSVLGGAAAAVDAARVTLTLLFGLLLQLTIVFQNDVADVATDRGNRTATPFSGGSRVLVDGHLRPEQLARAARGCGLGALLVSLPLGGIAVLLAAVGLTLQWLYSSPPARVSYRGGGEFLQMLGTGLVLPLYGHAAQTGGLSGYPFLATTPLLALAFANAIATALPDEPSDRADGKRTLAVRCGSRGAGALLFVAQATGLVGLSTIYALHRISTVFLVVAATAATGQFALLAARPGSHAMSVRVFLAMLASLLPILALLLTERTAPG